jgi:2-methylcitrate dehydratase PrpD
MLLDPATRWAAAQAAAPLEPHIAHHATRAVIDWVAATIAGGGLAPAIALRAALVDEAATGRARLLPDGRSVPPRTAALINATAAHTAEVDDIFRDGIYHPGAPTIAAAIAVGESRGVSGPGLLAAVTVGYEISNRIAAAVQPSHYRFWHTTGTVGTLGAAAAAGAVLQLDPGRFQHALANATTMAAGLQQAFRAEAMSKPLHAGHAADAGTLAALAAAAGLTGAADALEGPAGFAAAMSDGATLDGIFDDLGGRSTIAETTFKNHTCCGHTFAAIDAMLELTASHDLAPSRVERIEVATYGTAVEVAGILDPKTAFEAKFSLPYVVAAALHLGSVRLAAFAPAPLADPALRATVRSIALSVDPVLDAAFPGRRGARVTVHTTDGRELTSRRPTRRGDPDLPLTDDELDAKFVELVGEPLGSHRARELLDQLWQLPREATASDALTIPA